MKFETIKLSEKVKGVCGKCNKKAVVTIISEQNVNPFNKNRDGKIKNRQEVVKSVQDNLPILIKRWKDKFICRTCYRDLKWGEKWFRISEYDILHENDLT